MKTKKTIVAACFAVVAAGSAAAANFPDADGSHDIAWSDIEKYGATVLKFEF
ncbi:MAG: hypothetical protein IJG13_04115 [Kiritimatiellae bacterium]|nr:hypothetical protein [Kiritimatiellia bacterium]MBQ3344075.1 hypothetical protein [Kiritimatiellia bacterium]